jgi:ATP-dependent DNA ligase
MKVTLLVSRAGVDFTQAPGDLIEVSDDEGGRLIADGQAVAESSADVEAPPVKKAAKKVPA